MLHFSSGAAIALPKQIGGTDPAARGGWWLDYSEHATVLALAGVLAASRGPGWRILRGLCSAVWLYLGLVAALVLSHYPGSSGRIGGAAAVLVGVEFGLTRGADPSVKQPALHAAPCTRKPNPELTPPSTVRSHSTLESEAADDWE